MRAALFLCVNLLVLGVWKQVPPKRKLPYIYLMDSIVKNVQKPYTTHFAERLPTMFARCYKSLSEQKDVQQKMERVFKTWHHQKAMGAQRHTPKGGGADLVDLTAPVPVRHGAKPLLDDLPDILDMGAPAGATPHDGATPARRHGAGDDAATDG
eukprot:gene27605-34063_t